MSDSNSFHVLGPTDVNEEFMHNMDLQKIGLKVLVLAHLSLCFAALFDVTRSFIWVPSSCDFKHQRCKFVGDAFTYP